MAFQSGKLSKLQWGSYLAAALTHLLLRQNDAVGLVLFDNAVRTYLPPKARPTQFRRVLDLLEPEPAANDTDVGAVLHDIAERVRKRGLVIVISDLIDDAELGVRRITSHIALRPIRTFTGYPEALLSPTRGGKPA